MAFLPQRPPFEAEYGILSLEIRPWVRAATRPEVAISIGNCSTAARSMIWYEFILAVNNVPLHYIRFPFQSFGAFTHNVDAVLSGKYDSLYWVSDCPYGKLELSLDDHADGPPPRYRLSVYLSQGSEYAEIFLLDTSFELTELVADDLRDFASQMDQELAAMEQGQSPDPDSVPATFATLPLTREMNARAYDAVSTEYRPDYFATSWYREAFEGWLQSLPVAAAVVDVGCGHGEPVIAYLLDRGCQVTGLDLSPRMLALAKERFPATTFYQWSATDLNLSNAFDGACSCYSLTLLDPIELRVALKRLYQALKPGGHLLLVGGSYNTNSRTSPLTWWRGQPVWEWNYEPAEIRAALTASGLFSEVAYKEHLYDTPPIPTPVPAIEGIPPPPAWMNLEQRQLIYTLIAQKKD